MLWLMGTPTPNATASVLDALGSSLTSRKHEPSPYPLDGPRTANPVFPQPDSQVLPPRCVLRLRTGRCPVRLLRSEVETAASTHVA